MIKSNPVEKELIKHEYKYLTRSVILCGDKQSSYMLDNLLR